MLEIKYGMNLEVPGGPKFSVSNQIIKCEVYKHFSVTLDADQVEETVTLKEVKKLSLLVVKSTSSLAPDSPSKLNYKIGNGTPTALDAPLLILGSWINGIVADDLTLTFQIEPKPDNTKPKYAKDAVTVEVITGWADAE